MSMDAFDEAAERQALSALADGELAGAAGEAAFATWRHDAGARRDWHAWHLIGDVLRSEDLASDPRADLRFCAAVRTRLTAEAIVLAPAPAAATAASGVPAGGAARGRSGRWMFASAAAGFVLVAGTFAVVRSVDAPTTTPIALAGGNAVGVSGGGRDSASAASASVAAPAEAVAPPVAVVADSRLIRDAQLDRYLVAHKQFAGTSALGVPSVFLRSATVDSASR